MVSRHWLNLALLAISATAAPTILLDSDFEDAVAPWQVRRLWQGTDPVCELRTDAPFAGARCLAVGFTNKAHSRGNIRVAARLPRPDLAAGRLFRLHFAARTRPERGLRTRLEASIILDGVGTKQVFQIAPDRWQTFSMDAVYADDAPLERLEIELGFMSLTEQVLIAGEAYLDAIRVEQLPAPVRREPRSEAEWRSPDTATPAPAPPIPVHFSLPKSGHVTLVLEDAAGKRVRNLVTAQPFAAGDHTVYWDGLSEGRPKTTAGVPGYQIQREVIAPGSYQVRGLYRDPITLTYAFTLLPNTGQTPWPTDTGKREGGWLGDHGNPTATLFLPAARAPGGIDQMLLANSVNEAAHGLAWVDLDGNKLAGQRHLGGHWTGASHLAYDHGDKAHTDIYAYGRMDWTGKTKGKTGLRLTALTAHGDLVVATPEIDNTWDGGNPGDLAVHDGLLVYSAFAPDRLVFYDTHAVSAAQEAERLGSVELTKPHALAFDRQGRLLVVSGSRVLRYTLGDDPTALPEPEVLIAAGLDQPRDLAVDEAGRIYVAQWGQSHQIKVFAADGAELRTIGKPGGPQLGPYDPERMAFPYGLSIDSSGQLWVAARRWWVPKVVYVWTTDGQHVRNHYGPARYGGGGFLDPEDPTRFLYHNGHGGIEFRVDWQAGTATPASIYHLPYGAVNDRWDQRVEMFNTKRGPGGGVAFPYRARGHRYISNSFSNASSGPATLMLLADRTPDGAPPLLMLGKVGSYEKQLKHLGLWDQLPFTAFRHPGHRFNGAHKTLFLWTDHNRDRQVQADEFQFYLPPALVDDPAGYTGRNKNDWVMQGAGIINSIELGDDLAVHIRSHAGRQRNGLVLRLRPTRIDDDALPHYDLTQYEEVLEESFAQRASSNVLPLADDRLLATGGPIQGFKDGQLDWFYHSQWPSLHTGHAGPRSPQYPGQLIATTRVLGPAFTPKSGEAGELWALNSNLGLAYLFTADGLLVDTLFNYRKNGRIWNFPECERGMDVTDVNLIDECFFPTITRLDDGRVVLVAGKTHSSVVELHGLDSIRRFTADPIDVTVADIATIQQHARDVAAWERAQDQPERLLVTRIGRPLEDLLDDALAEETATEETLSIDGRFEDWAEPTWITVQRERLGAGFGGRDVAYTTAALACDDEHLYLALRTRARDLLANEGGSLQHLFKTGGGLDLHLAARTPAPDRKQPVEGDVRLLIAHVQGKTVAVRYRPIVPGTTKPVIYDSPVAETRIDAVDDVSSHIRLATARVTLPDRNKTAQFEQIEVAIPLTVLGWAPNALPRTVGDIGILVGERGVTTQRIYWHNKAAGIVSDIPSEARLEPATWGDWQVVEEDQL